MKEVINKWNNDLFLVKEENGNDVTLIRVKDNYTFTIKVSEFNFSYKIKK